MRPPPVLVVPLHLQATPETRTDKHDIHVETSPHTNVAAAVEGTPAQWTVKYF